MKIVIDIDDSEYKEIVEDRNINYLRIIKAIKNGTPLPKGYGRMIDADALQKQAIKVELKYLQRELDVITRKQIIDAPTIIESDKEGEG